MILETTDRIFGDFAGNALNDSAEAGNWPQSLWQTLEDTGLVLAGVSEKAGGIGGDRMDALEIIKRSAYHAIPLPLADTFLAAWLIEECGGEVPAGPIGIACGTFDFTHGVLGKADSVVFAPWCRQFLCANEDGLALVPASATSLQAAGKNMAGEPLADIKVEASADLVSSRCWNVVRAHDRMMQLGAMIRSFQIAGALESALSLAVEYATQRQQFGRPIARFQAIQHQLAIAAGEVAAAGQAADVAGRSQGFTDTCVAKARTGEAAGIVSEIAHQVMGAIGYTLEHDLNHRTRRIWTWRDDYGNESYWNILLGERLIEKGGNNLWSAIVDQAI